MSTPPAPAPTPVTNGRLSFDEFELDIANARLLRAGRVVDLTPKSFALLACLAERPGELVLKDTLLDLVWQRRFVSEGAVKTVVSELRAALGDNARQPRCIETVQRRGYRFIGRLRGTTGAPSDAPAAPRAAETAGANVGLGSTSAASHRPATPEASRGNLPLSLPRLIGRESERTTLLDWIPRRRLVTIAGTAGVGKTQLALTLAQAVQPRFADGAWLLELATLDAAASDAATLRASVALALQHPATAATTDATLARALVSSSLLLVLDNAEHLLGVLAPLLQHLLEQAPGVHLLVTSREPLQLPDEQVFRLESLPLPPADDSADPETLMRYGAVQFFVDRVSARVTGFRLRATHAASTAQLCRDLDGLPLALELAAARVPVLGINGLAERIADEHAPDTRLRLLTQGSRTAAPHQRTLRSTLDWSHALLTPVEQRVFRRLAAFCGSFTLESAQRVCTDDELDGWAVLDALHALIEKSMLSASVQGPAGGRFSLLESLRAYAQEQALGAGELPAIQRRFLRASVAYWAAADAASLEAGAHGWIQAHVPEVGNLRAALRWAQQATVDGCGDFSLRDDWLALVGSSGTVWHRAGLTAEGVQQASAALDAARAHGDARRLGGVCMALASLAAFANNPQPADGLAYAGLAAQSFEQVRDAERAYYAHYLAWTLSLHCQRPQERAAHLERMRALLQPLWSPMLQRFWRGCEAYERRLAGDIDAYLTYARAELALRRRVGALWESWVAGHALALAECDRGDIDAAIAVLDDVLAEVRLAGRLHQNAARVSLRTSLVAQHRGAAASRAALSEATRILAAAGTLKELGLPLAWLALREQRLHDAATLLAWHEGPRGAGSKYGAGTYLHRSANQLGDELARRLDDASRTTCGARASELEVADVMRMGLPEPVDGR